MPTFIVTAQGDYFRVDADAPAWVFEAAWTTVKGGYAKAGKSYLHKAVLGLEHAPKTEFEVDHRDNNRSDCRRSNLRVCTTAQNQHNTRLRKDSTTGVKGVSRLRNGRFRAYLKVAGKQREVGRFDTLELAADAIRAARLELHGEFANAG